MPPCPAGHIMREAHIVAEGSIICPTWANIIEKNLAYARFFLGSKAATLKLTAGCSGL